MAGYRTFAGTPDSWTNYTVGPLGRVLASVQQTHLRGDSASYFYPFTYAHYAGGALASLTYPSQHTFTSCYDGHGRPSWVSAARTQSDCKGGSGSGALYANASAYWPHGAIQSLSYGNGLVESAAYNNRLQPTSIGVGSLWLVGYDYGSSTANNGNLLTQTQTAPGMNVVTAYKYDKANRMAVAVEQPVNAADPVCGVGNLAANGWCHQYGYDRWGNRRIAGRVNDGQGVAEPGSFNPANNRIADSTWQYEGRGAVTKDAEGRSYGYDGESRMVATCSPQNGELPCPAAWGAGREIYTYDAEGRRVRRDDKGGGQTVYVYDAAGQLAAEYATQAPPALCTTCYLTADHLGSTRMLTDASGAVKERLDYQPFGPELLATSGSPRSGIAGYGSLSDSGVPLKFTGKERDGETVLDYFGARYFSGAQGRWTIPDWSAKPEPVPYADLNDPQTLNLYAYVRNNPLARRDLDGHCDKSDKATPNTRCQDPNSLQVNDYGKKHIVKKETGGTNPQLTVYKDGAGLPTVGYGHKVTKGDGLRVGGTVTKDQADALRDADMTSAANAVKKAVGKTQLSQGEYNAFVDLVFNAGPGALSDAKSPSLMKALASGDYKAMSEQLMYSKDEAGKQEPGLVTRSNERKEVFLGKEPD